jgi:hypothetical protein
MPAGVGDDVFMIKVYICNLYETNGMAKSKSKIVVSKTTFDEEQRQKDEAFLKLKPIERLIIHEQLRKRIWGDRYNKLSLKGLKVIKKPVQK